MKKKKSGKKGDEGDSAAPLGTARESGGGLEGTIGQVFQGRSQWTRNPSCARPQGQAAEIRLVEVA